MIELNAFTFIILRACGLSKSHQSFHHFNPLMSESLSALLSQEAGLFYNSYQTRQACIIQQVPGMLQYHSSRSFSFSRHAPTRLILKLKVVKDAISPLHTSTA
jgi:hypothetical protein